MVKFVMWFTYVLKSEKNGRFYTGYTSNIDNRIKEHNSLNGSVYTSKNAPYTLPVRRLDDVRAARELDLVWQPKAE